MWLLRSIVRILRRIVDDLGHQFPMGDTITAQFIGHDLSGLTAMWPEQPPEEAFGCSAISLGLEIYINDFTVLIYSAPKIVLLAIYLYEYFINVKGVAVASMLSFQSTSIDGTELNAPKADRFATDSDASLSHQVLKIAVAEIESVIEPDSIRNDIWRESMALVSIHGPILSISTS
jgi:hypothetical protein